MIRVGNGKPACWFVEAHNDMSHFTPSHYTTNDFYWMHEDDCLEKEGFANFNMNPSLSKEELNLILEKTKSDRINDIHFIESPWAYKMNQLIKKAGNSQLWQFNAVSSDKKGYVRQVVALGSNSLVRWSWFDANVKLPALQKKRDLLNALNSSRAQKEIEEWDRFLNKVYNKKGD